MVEQGMCNYHPIGKSSEPRLKVNICFVSDWLDRFCLNNGACHVGVLRRISLTWGGRVEMQQSVVRLFASVNRAANFFSTVL